MRGGSQSLAYRFAVLVCKPLLTLLTRRRWSGTQHIPASGGIVVCPNHVSHLDPFVVGHVLHDHGRPPRFLAKESVFAIPGVGGIVAAAGQIPVRRESHDELHSLAAAVTAVRAGECVVVYPEGTLTRDPDGWPMAGKTGAARIALETGCPLLPMAQWGAQALLPGYSHHPRPRPRTRVEVRIGPPVSMQDLAGEPLDADVLARATDRIMDRLTHELAVVRGLPAPTHRWDPRAHPLPRTGDPRRHRRHDRGDT